MSFEDVIKNFSILDVVKTWEVDELRIRGKFLRIQDVDQGDPNNELVVSKWFYKMNLYK